MTFLTARRTNRIAATFAVLSLAIVGIAAAPKSANAWYRYGYVYGPRVVVVQPRVFYRAPVYYAPRVFVPARPGYWVPGRW